MDEDSEKFFQFALFTEQTNICQAYLRKIKTIHHCNILRAKSKACAMMHAYLTLICLKSTIEILEKDVKYVPNCQ